MFYGHCQPAPPARTLALACLACVRWPAASSIPGMTSVDAPKDRLAPDRCHRPLASGALAPWEALVLASGLLAALLGTLGQLPGRAALLIGIYGALNLLYSLGLKKILGPRQAIIAIGFWLRLQTGAFPVAAIPLTPWASLFTLGLAYYLNSLKGLAGYEQPEHRGYRFAMGLGAGLAGSLALASLVAICLKRGVEGTMALPEMPPLLCLVGMHRVAFASFDKHHGKEQSAGSFSILSRSLPWSVSWLSSSMDEMTSLAGAGERPWPC